MNAEALSFFGLIILAVIFYGVLEKDRITKMLGSILLLVFGLFIIASGIDIKAGQVETINQISECPLLCEQGLANTTTTNSTITYTDTYSKAASPVGDLGQILGVAIILISFIGIYSVVV
jgi:uncharacterized protein YijF (DUF1287 family)